MWVESIKAQCMGKNGYQLCKGILIIVYFLELLWVSSNNPFLELWLSSNQPILSSIQQYTFSFIIQFYSFYIFSLQFLHSNPKIRKYITSGIRAVRFKNGDNQEKYTFKLATGSKAIHGAFLERKKRGINKSCKSESR